MEAVKDVMSWGFQKWTPADPLSCLCLFAWGSSADAGAARLLYGQCTLIPIIMRAMGLLQSPSFLTPSSNGSLHVGQTSRESTQPTDCLITPERWLSGNGGTRSGWGWGKGKFKEKIETSTNNYNKIAISTKIERLYHLPKNMCVSGDTFSKVNFRRRPPNRQPLAF